MDKAQKKAGVPNSLSRKEEKANKKNTNKKRRQDDRKSIHECSHLSFKEYLMESKGSFNPKYNSAQAINAKNTECETCGKRTKKADTRMVKGKLSCPSCAKEEK